MLWLYEVDTQGHVEYECELKNVPRSTIYNTCPEQDAIYLDPLYNNDNNNIAPT